jgi:hypothetical protein
LGMLKHEKIEKVTGSRDDKWEGGVSIWVRLVIEGTAGPSTLLPRISCGRWWRWQISCAFP